MEKFCPAVRRPSFCWETPESRPIQTATRSCWDLRHFHQRFWLHHREDILRRIEQKHTRTHAENHSVHLHTQRDTSTAEAVFTKQQTDCPVILAMLEKSNSAPNHEDLRFLCKVPSLQQIPLLTDSNHLPRMGETFRKAFPSNQCPLIQKEQNPEARELESTGWFAVTTFCCCCCCCWWLKSARQASNS